MKKQTTRILSLVLVATLSFQAQAWGLDFWKRSKAPKAKELDFKSTRDLVKFLDTIHAKNMGEGSIDCPLLPTPQPTAKPVKLVVEVKPEVVKPVPTVEPTTTPLVQSEAPLKIIAREVWDKGEIPTGGMSLLLKSKEEKLRFAALHHTAGHDNETMAQIKAGHLARDFTDIAYHYVIPKKEQNEGEVFEGRNIKFQGAHSGGSNAEGVSNNLRSIGISMMGNFEPFHPTNNPGGSSDEVPTPFQEKTLKRLLDHLKLQFPELHQLLPHRALKPTACPGEKAMYLINLNN